MKNITLAIIVFISTISFSQIENGRKSIGGIFNIYNYKQEISTKNNGSSDINKIKSEFNFKINPYIEFMISEKLAFGIAPGFHYTKTIEYSSIDNRYDNTIKEKLYYISPYMKTYKKIGDKLYFSLDFGVALAKGTYEQMILNNTNNGIIEDDPMKLFRIIPNIGVGFQYFLNNNLAFNFQWSAIQYYYETIKQEKTVNKSYIDYTVTTSELSLNLDMSSLYIGLSYYF